MDQANHSSFSSRLSLFGKASEDRGSILASALTLHDQFDKILINPMGAMVKPVADIPALGNPFQIIGSGVKLVFILVMDKGKTVRVGNETFGNNSVEKGSHSLPVFGKFDLGVPVASTTRLADAPPDVTVSTAPVIDKAADAGYPAKVTDLVETFVSGNISPLFVRESDGFRDKFREKLKQPFFYVKNSSLSTSGNTEVDHQVSVVSGRFKDFWGHNSGSPKLAMCNHPSATPYTGMIRQFVIRMTGNWLPYFAILVQFISGKIREKFAHFTADVHPNSLTAPKEIHSAAVQRQEFAARVLNLTSIGNRVGRGFWDREPLSFGHQSVLNYAKCFANKQEYTGLCGEMQEANYSAMSMAGGASCP